MQLRNFFILLIFHYCNARINLKNITENFDVEKLKWGIRGSASLKCSTDLLAYIMALSRLNFLEEDQWAVQMLDSTAKVPEGILTGNMVHIGQFDECLAVKHPSGQFKGKHCMLQVIFNSEKSPDVFKSSHRPFNFQRLQRDDKGADVVDDTLPLKHGICIPSTCTADDLNSVLNTDIIQSILSATADDENCWTSDPITLSDGSWAFISLIIILVALALISTLYETYQLLVLKNLKQQGLLNAFSLYSNTISMVEVRDSAGEMSCLHGIRTLSMMWVLICHTYLNAASLPLINLLDASDLTDGQEHIFIINGFYSVDSFFFLSGLLVAFVFFRNIGRNGYFDAPLSYLHRYLRLTPTFLIMILFSITLLKDIDKGPLWNDAITPQVTACEENWWSSLLYLQNYLKPDAVCLGQSWYLSADMQMFWISPFILYPLYLWPKYGMAILGFITLASTLWTFGLAYANEYHASILIMTSSDQFKYDYIATHARIMPWLVGIALGFAICAMKAKRFQIKLSKVLVLLGWIFSTTVCLACLYGYTRFQGDSSATFLESAFYLAFTRLAWAVGLTWIVFACINGYGGVINSFLSMGIFQPLGKLSYNVYLIHMTILAYKVGVSRTNYHLEDFNLIYDFFGTLILSYLFAIVLFLLVEAPMANIDRALLNSVKILPYPRPKINDIGKGPLSPPSEGTDSTNSRASSTV